jgi:hypothetical protein
VANSRDNVAHHPAGFQIKRAKTWMSNQQPICDLLKIGKSAFALLAHGAEHFRGGGHLAELQFKSKTGCPRLSDSGGTSSVVASYCPPGNHTRPSYEAEQKQEHKRPRQGLWRRQRPESELKFSKWFHSFTFLTVSQLHG